MCLSVPAQVIEIGDKEHAIVDYGDGTQRKVNVTLVDAKIGDYVLVHAGFAIQTIDEKEARATIDIFKEMMEG
ncbi:MAG: HypC/HybG/HupF family hydrogenase formation chaperone [Methanomicrobia archaeon]|jgi:hydrogenase expression/formation protein HypC|nr:HypC/HybG/HupF family hydrogenase formation chaperone [Methanomicrobia archaeon]MCK4433564.1 HypC/HybG/HupF family hydrogenase formation chaperone [Methanomicrobia archaeon]MCK4636610.1 HypC/HybG/HupF family hydrogenase formation chaperone [Methanomicrobia archaeon]